MNVPLPRTTLALPPIINGYQATLANYCSQLLVDSLDIL